MSVSMGPTVEIKVTINGICGFTPKQAEYIRKWIDEAYEEGYKEGRDVRDVNTITTTTPPIYPYPTYQTYKIGDDPNNEIRITCDTPKANDYPF